MEWEKRMNVWKWQDLRMEKQVSARLLRASRLLTKHEGLIHQAINPSGKPMQGSKWGNGIIRPVLEMDHSGCRAGE